MIFGRFYFAQTDSDNLLGEFSHNDTERIRSESADLNSPFSEGFDGTYSSTWFDEGIQSLTLIIEPKSANDNRILTLSWANDSQVIFHGEGFIANEILIGSY